MQSEISTAVVLYIGFGVESHPRHDIERLNRAFGPAQATELTKRVKELIVEISSFVVDWNANTLISGTAQAREFMHKQRPELSDQALDALAWDFSWSWR